MWTIIRWLAAPVAAVVAGIAVNGLVRAMLTRLLGLPAGEVPNAIISESNERAAAVVIVCAVVVCIAMIEVGVRVAPPRNRRPASLAFPAVIFGAVVIAPAFGNGHLILANYFLIVAVVGLSCV